eukprot:TRINITY_DN4599_c0_g1_i1.p1 TRINITY_DN4599_c0_g1~~TRINITY_DN4599_c0_g1_i1.p1  ORF type:complete len:247 (+),score=83.21 TRINITY_DN4599_c0_g1_i1:199-939(+)
MADASQGNLKPTPKGFAEQRRNQQQQKHEFEKTIQHGLSAERREGEVAKHAQRLQRTMNCEPEVALRIARKQNGASSGRPKGVVNRLQLLKDSPLERAAHGTPWQQHGIRPAPTATRRRAAETAKSYGEKQRRERKEVCNRRQKKPQSALNLMEKQDSADKKAESDDDQFPEKPDMQIFSLVDDESDDDLGEIDAAAIQYMRLKSQQRRLVQQAYESSKEHKKEALRLLNAPQSSNTQSIFDWTFD